MTDREAIEMLKATPPKPERTRWQRAARIGAFVFAGVALLALVTAVYAVREAVVGPGRVSDCVNQTLGIRQTFSDEDHANERQKIYDQAAAERTTSRAISDLLSAKTPAESLAAAQLYTLGVNQFSRSLADWTARDKAISAERAKHPLGKC